MEFILLSILINIVCQSAFFDNQTNIDFLQIQCALCLIYLTYFFHALSILYPVLTVCTPGNSDVCILLRTKKTQKVALLFLLLFE